MKGSSLQGGGTLRGRGARVRFDSVRSETANTPTTPSVCAGDGVVSNFDSTSQDSYSASNSAPNSAAISPSTSVVHSDSLCPSSAENPSTPATMSERRRTLSLSSRREDSIDDELCPDAVTPYEPRNFPISDTEYDTMLRESMHLQSCEDEAEDGLCLDPEKSNDGTITANTSRAPSPTHSEAGESVADHIEDVDDPEWEPKKE